ncbi:MAG: hypothetical protein IJZ56_05020 [Oscillospiraceae bacterium]|nr:hypothetical protein [Oscillospiraceae bacterium]
MAKGKMNRIALEAGFCITIFVLYLVGTVCFAMQCVAMIIFGEQAVNLRLALPGLTGFVVHYLLLWFGYKKGFLDRFVIRGLRILDWVLYGIWSGGWSLFAIFLQLMAGFDNDSIILILLIFAVIVVVLLLREITSRKMLAGLKAEQEGDPPVPTEPDTTDLM